MLKFAAVLNGKQVRQFSAASMTTIYRQFNRYCKGRGFTTLVEVPLAESFGGVAWSNGSESIVLVKQS